MQMESSLLHRYITAQLRAFWERLLYPGQSPKKIPTAVIYTMNMTEEQEQKYAASPLKIIDMYALRRLSFRYHLFCGYFCLITAQFPINLPYHRGGDQERQ